MGRGRLPSVLLLALLVLTAASSTNCTTPATGNPLAGKTLYRTPGSAAEQQAIAWDAAGRRNDAATIRKIAAQPAARWFGADANITDDVNTLLSAAAQAGQVPVLVAYNIPGRDWGGFSSGGAASSAEYLSWLDRFAAGLGQKPAIVIVEPDAVAQAVDGCMPSDQVAERFRLVRAAVEKLSADRSAIVYLDAGNAGWPNRPEFASALRQAGAEEASGLVVN